MFKLIDYEFIKTKQHHEVVKKLKYGNLTTQSLKQIILEHIDNQLDGKRVYMIEASPDKIEEINDEMQN